MLHSTIHHITQYLIFKVQSKRLTASHRGQGMVEYALILVLVAVVVIAVLTQLGPLINGVLLRVACGIDPKFVFTNAATGFSGDCQAHGIIP